MAAAGLGSPKLRVEGPGRKGTAPLRGATDPSRAHRVWEPLWAPGPSAGPGLHREPLGISCGRGESGAGRDPALSHRVRGAGTGAPNEGPARKSREWAGSRGGHSEVRRGTTRAAERPRAIPGHEQEFTPEVPRERVEGRGLCVRACVRVTACERAREIKGCVCPGADARAPACFLLKVKGTGCRGLLEA